MKTKSIKFNYYDGETEFELPNTTDKILVYDGDYLMVGIFDKIHKTHSGQVYFKLIDSRSQLEVKIFVPLIWTYKETFWNECEEFHKYYIED